MARRTLSRLASTIVRSGEPGKSKFAHYKKKGGASVKLAAAERFMEPVSLQQVHAGYRWLGAPDFAPSGAAIIGPIHLMSVPGPPGCG